MTIFCFLENHALWFKLYLEEKNFTDKTIHPKFGKKTPKSAIF